MVTFLIENVCLGCGVIFASCAFVVFVPAPEAAAWIALAKPLMGFEESSRAARLEKYLCILHRISLWDIHEKMHMIPGEAKGTEFETTGFELAKRARTSVNM